MEEKERYEIHIYDDICVDLYDNGVLDKSINDTYKLEELLNQQDKRIKEETNEKEFWHIAYQGKQLDYDMVYAELRKIMEENQQLKDQVKKSYQEGLLQKQFDKDMEIQELKDKIEQLKQSQKQLATGELRRIKEYILTNDKYDEEAGCNIIETFDLIEDIIDRIEKLGGCVA